MTDSAAQRHGGWIPLLFPILVGLAVLASIELTDVMGWLLVQPTALVLSGLILLSTSAVGCSPAAWPIRQTG
ncbi:Ca2+:H+ antiporter [Synechococcus sp. A18-40]|nr:Ca2+:H+ antiporter [Synechococcus sp. A18-40]